MVISTHQTEDVAALCERVVVLDGGSVLFDGTVTDMVGQAAGRVWMAAERDPAAQYSWRTGQRPGPQRRRPAAVRRAHRAGPRGRLPAAGRRRSPRHRSGGRVMSCRGRILTAIERLPCRRSGAEGWPTLRALARVEAQRFARHPLFLLGVAILLIPMVAAVWQQRGRRQPDGRHADHRLPPRRLRLRRRAPADHLAAAHPRPRDDDAGGPAAAHARAVPGLPRPGRRRGRRGRSSCWSPAAIWTPVGDPSARTSPGSGTTPRSTCSPR